MNVRAAIAASPDPWRAQDLARRLGLPVLDAAAVARAGGAANAEDEFDALLQYADGAWLLTFAGRDAPGPLRVDFLAGAMRARWRTSRRSEPLPRAVLGARRGRGRDSGAAAEEPPLVFDATAGLGRDAWVLASHGCRVVAVERSSLLGALVADALHRAASDPAAGPIAERIELRSGDAREHLVRFEAPVDVVYVDPMFEPAGRSALARKEAQALQRLVPRSPGDADTERELLELARARARRRVVVKRHRRAPVLGGVPSYSVDGKAVRFDVYLSAR